MFDFLNDIPVLGEVWQGLQGNPDQIKAAYDAQIKASQQQQQQMQQMLMANKAQSQALYGPMKHMFQNAYGTEGIQGPQVPGGTPGMGPLSKAYGGR